MEQESEIKKQLGYLRSLQIYLTESGANVKEQSRIIEMFQHPLHRSIKLNCYTLLKTFGSEDLSVLKPTIVSDLKSTDMEIQLCSLKLIELLPLESVIEILKSHDVELCGIIEGGSGRNAGEFHYERVITIHGILMMSLCMESSVDELDFPRQSILVMYQRICENCFNSNRDISGNCILVCGNLLLNESRLRNPQNLVGVDLSDVRNVVVGYLGARVGLLQERIDSYELRMRSRMISLVSMIMRQELRNGSVEMRLNVTVSGTPQQVVKVSKLLEQLFEKHMEMLTCLEIDVLIQTFQSIIIVQQSMINQQQQQQQQQWRVFNSVMQYVLRVGYSKEVNVILTNMLKWNNNGNSESMSMSMKILEVITTNRCGMLSRFLVMLMSFHNILKSKQASVVMSLFSQQWFINKIKEEDRDEYDEQHCLKEELVICLIVSGIQIGNNPHYDEILDLSYRMLNWKSQKRTDLMMLSIEMYLLLIEEALKYLSASSLSPRMLELVTRINSNEIDFIPKIKTLHLLSRKFTHSSLPSTINYMQALADIRNYIIQSITPKYLSTLQTIFQTLYYLNLNFHLQDNQLKSNILELLSDYNDHLIETIKTSSTTNHNILKTILEYIKQLVPIIQYAEIVSLDSLIIPFNNLLTTTTTTTTTTQSNTSPTTVIINNHTTNHHVTDVLHVAYNVFLNPFNSTTIQPIHYQSQKLIHNLKALPSIQSNKQHNIFYALEMHAQLITGVCDLVQVYVAHVVDTATSSICLGLRVVNLSPFKLDNLSIKLLLDPHTHLQLGTKPIQMIEEMPSYQTRCLFYVVKADPSQSIQFAFDIQLQEYLIRTQLYRISLISFLIPNLFLSLASNAFNTVWAHLDHSYHTSCTLHSSYLALFATLEKKPFGLIALHQETLYTELVLIENGTLTFALLAYLTNGATLAIAISHIPTNGLKAVVQIEIKSTLPSCIDSFTNEMETLILDLADGQLTTFLND